MKKMTMGSKMAIATSVCKKKGVSDFGKGSKGEACREKVAGGIEKKYRVVKGPARRKRG